MRLTLADDTGALTMIKHVNTPEQREELLQAVRTWKLHEKRNAAGDGLLMMLEAFLAPLVAADKEAAEDPTA